MPVNESSRRRRILAISSGGGHWIELLRLRPAFEGAEIAYVTVRKSYRGDLDGERFYVVRDATRWSGLSIIVTVLQVLWVLVRVRPDVIVTTGAAPGYFAVRFGRLLGARTVWLDSIANAEELSMSGRIAGEFADLWLTQWKHLATRRGPIYLGAVL